MCFEPKQQQQKRRGNEIDKEIKNGERELRARNGIDVAQVVIADYFPSIIQLLFFLL